MSLDDREGNPVLSRLRSLIEAGHAAAACVVTERDGSPHFDLPLDAGVFVEATYSGKPTTTLTLIEVLDRATRDRVPVALAARPGSYWTIACARLPTRNGFVVAAVDDLRPVLEAPFWTWERPREITTKATAGPFGDRLTRAVQQTTIEGAKARLEEGKRRIGAKERDIVASARAELFLSKDWPPLLTWYIVETTKEGNSRYLASSPDLGLVEPPARWQQRQFQAVLRAFEMDAGTGRHQSRGEHLTFETLVEEPADRSAETDTLLETLELNDLVARAKLTDRQREVLALYYRAGRTDAEIASQLGIAVSTVTNTRSRALEKLRTIA
jgi:RNA polymerase sigma factor (sigma-70 family)